MDISILKSSLPQLVKTLSNWFELDLSIKLFGVSVFTFHWPPKEQIVEP